MRDGKAMIWCSTWLAQIRTRHIAGIGELRPGAPTVHLFPASVSDLKPCLGTLSGADSPRRHQLAILQVAVGLTLTNSSFRRLLHNVPRYDHALHLVGAFIYLR